ncbi:3' terminal RNA ribose 2'-O-methyltransferase Hen1 [Bradyrhizobium manausense]|uniref:3' terminal RNA ribose 2'-O-methyltransferase Hen1 n=1 Tax=Bradyrhizobium manausense TaxID=989370 RepID=UPI001BABE973|nr:3' terminal RNA ribose 2'-O-methyltransferase Hen1 [Bradyrhizobium manausense]MBR0838095.1 3' terminal RNA ribose 2'-O-methyltransferase Hen1 [Bradyrhizobium manausense]
MFLSIATTYQPATDLGFLLNKHPERMHELELSYGKVFVFYPEASDSRCEAALVLDVDPVGLVRGKGQGEGLLDQYVNDRPYAASSFLSVALNKTFRTAMSGVSSARQELADSDLPLEAVVAPLPMRGGEHVVRQLFEPLGWRVDIDRVPNPNGDVTGKAYARLRLSGMARLSALLNHLYVLVPVMDDAKHYWVGDEEIDKLLKRGEGWLEQHPAKELIVRRYLRHRGTLARAALERLAPETKDELLEPDERRGADEDTLETPIRLNDQRMAAVVEALRATGAKTVADLGCGEGKLLQYLVRERWPERLIGLDPAVNELQRAAKRLKLNMPGGPPEGRLSLLHGSLTYQDKRWAEADAAALVEVIEHLDPDRLPLVERVVFGAARPRAIIVTTPNAEYNVLFPTLAAGSFRHRDHRFEWTRAEFQTWAGRIGTAYGYRAEFSGIGASDPALGSPTQMAVFTR